IPLVDPGFCNRVCGILFAALGTDLAIRFRFIAAMSRVMMLMIRFCADTSLHYAAPLERGPYHRNPERSRLFTYLLTVCPFPCPSRKAILFPTNYPEERQG